MPSFSQDGLLTRSSDESRRGRHRRQFIDVRSSDSPTDHEVYAGDEIEYHVVNNHNSENSVIPSDWDLLQMDSDLDAIRSTAEFQELIQKNLSTSKADR